MKIKKRILSLALAGAMTLGLMPGMSATALASDGDTSYTLTIPSTLSVANSGWNATDGISATGSLEGGNKLAVTATSGDEFALVNGENKVGYKLAESGDTSTTYANATEKTAWEFTTLSGDAATLPMGIVVDDYSTEPAGTYTDAVTFTASVVSAANKLTLTGEYMDHNGGGFVTRSLEIEYTDNDTWKDIAERYDEVSLQDNIYGPSEGKVVMFWTDMSQHIRGCELKSSQSTYQYDLVSINDKVSAYNSYYLQ